MPGKTPSDVTVATETQVQPMPIQSARNIIAAWPEESREAAQLVLDKYGEPAEATDSFLVWHGAGPWKRIVATRQFWRHDFPTPHFDSVESAINHVVPVESYSSLAAFDGSVKVERTSGELSARCHDERANSLALNLAHDIVTGHKTVQEARDYYAAEFLAYRRREPAPYMNGLQFSPAIDPSDPDRPVISEEELRAATEEGKKRAA